MGAAATQDNVNRADSSAYDWTRFNGLADPRSIVPPPQFPDWGLGNIVDPFGFLRTLSSGGDPGQRDPYIAYRQPGQGQTSATDPNAPFQLNPVDSSAEVQTIRNMATSLGMAPWQIDAIFQLASDGADIQSIMDWMTSARESNLVEEQRKLTEQYRTEGGVAVDETEKYLKGILGQYTDQSVIDDPTKPLTLRKDVLLNPSLGYATELADADAFINANINRARSTASAAEATTGTRGSGKMAGNIRDVEQQGAFSKGQYRNAAWAGAREMAGGAREGLSRIPGLRADLTSGVIDKLGGIGSLATSLKNPSIFGSGRGTTFDTQSLNFGRNDADFAKFMDILTTAISASQQAGESLSSTLTSFAPGG